MSIKAIFPPGLAELTVHGLHQWDYGRKLKVMAEGLPAQVEIHFACAGMETAVVRFCGATNGAFLAAIPDQCLEQTTPIVAWVCEVGETSGKTLLTVTLPIIARTKPQPAPTVPEDVSDKYTEAVAAMNKLVKEFEDLKPSMVEDIAVEVRNEIYNNGLRVDEADRADRADVADNADAAAVLSLSVMVGYDNEGAYVVSVESGIYAVVAETKTSTATFFIAIPDPDTYTIGTSVNCVAPDQDAARDAVVHYYSSQFIVTPGNGIRHPILGVYKLAAF